MKQKTAVVKSCKVFLAGFLSVFLTPYLTGRIVLAQFYPRLCLGLWNSLGFYRHYRLRLSNSSKLDCIILLAR